MSNTTASSRAPSSGLEAIERHGQRQRRYNDRTYIWPYHSMVRAFGRSPRMISAIRSMTPTSTMRCLLRRLERDLRAPVSIIGRGGSVRGVSAWRSKSMMFHMALAYDCIHGIAGQAGTLPYLVRRYLEPGYELAAPRAALLAKALAECVLVGVERDRFLRMMPMIAPMGGRKCVVEFHI